MRGFQLWLTAARDKMTHPIQEFGRAHPDRLHAAGMTERIAGARIAGDLSAGTSDLPISRSGGRAVRAVVTVDYAASCTVRRLVRVGPTGKTVRRTSSRAGEGEEIRLTGVTGCRWRTAPRSWFRDGRCASRSPSTARRDEHAGKLQQAFVIQTEILSTASGTGRQADAAGRQRLFDPQSHSLLTGMSIPG